MCFADRKVNFRFFHTEFNLPPRCLDLIIRNVAAAQWVGEGASLSSETMADYYREHMACVHAHNFTFSKILN